MKYFSAIFLCELIFLLASKCTGENSFYFDTFNNGMEFLRNGLKRHSMSPSEKVDLYDKLQILHDLTPYLDMKEHADVIADKMTSQMYTSGVTAGAGSCVTDLLMLVGAISKKEIWAVKSKYA